jgi:hypothetical protein
MTDAIEKCRSPVPREATCRPSWAYMEAQLFSPRLNLEKLKLNATTGFHVSLGTKQSTALPWRGFMPQQ